MEQNILLEQYSQFKQAQLKESPFRFLLNTQIEINPHQINAFCAAVQALKTGGIILADEVGLGKTIEAGLVLKYVLGTGAKNVLISLPATLRKQWEQELIDKFDIRPVILDRATVENDFYTWNCWFMGQDKTRIVIASYDYSSRLIKRFPKVIWDFIIIDEAHNLRNVFHNAKRAKNLFDVTKHIPKILLTATPLQNSLSDLHGLISFIDPRIFGDEASFTRRFITSGEYDKLKEELRPVLYRTLRRDVSKYMDFKKRECHTVDFTLSVEETVLYQQVNSFLRRGTLYSIPTTNKGLIILVIRKLLASSSFALIDTFEVLRDRLEKLIAGTKSANAQDGFDLFWSFVEDEIDESDWDSNETETTIFQKQQMEDEMELIEQIIETATKIKANAKIIALKTALNTAFEIQKQKGIAQKAVVFTESKRTQKYIAEELRNDGYAESDIILFNGDFNDTMTKEIYDAWQVKNHGKPNYGRSVEYKHAIVDYFKNNAKILIVTDTGSEGLNLQFCNTVINYDLPWNPQKIEQRIGRCHRYGQEHDVIAINLLNTGNEADKRIYEILTEKFELFSGVFGASDVALGALESGTNFEKKILDIFQRCNTTADFKKEFDNLDKQLDSKQNAQGAQLRNLLLTENPESKGAALEKTFQDVTKYITDVEYWNQFAAPWKEDDVQYWRIDNWGQNCLGSHGYLFFGAFLNNYKVAFPVLLLCDENGNYVDFSEEELVSALERADDSDVHFLKPTPNEENDIDTILDRLTLQIADQYSREVAPIMETNKHRVENWAQIRCEQLNEQKNEMVRQIEELNSQASFAIDSLRKSDIQKEIREKKKKQDKFLNGLQGQFDAIAKDAANEITTFNQKYEIRNPSLFINVVLKF